MHCFAINLESNFLRRQQIEHELGKLECPFEIVNAVDGWKLNPDELEHVYDKEKAAANYRELSKTEVGCSLSHISVYKKIMERGLSYAFVVEDDAVFNEDTVPVLQALAESADQDNPAIVLLTHVDYYTRMGEKRISKDYYQVRPVSRHVWLAHGYFITREAAKRLIEVQSPVWLPADHWKYFEKNAHIRVTSIVPYCVGMSGMSKESNIEKDRKSRIKQFRAKEAFPGSNFVEQLKKLAWPFMKVRKQKRTW